MPTVELPGDGLLQFRRHVLADGHDEQLNVLLPRQTRLLRRRRQPVGRTAVDDENADLFSEPPPSVFLHEALTPHVLDDLGRLRRAERFCVEHQ